jgi:hypothetical protein
MRREIPKRKKRQERAPRSSSPIVSRTYPIGGPTHLSTREGRQRRRRRALVRIRDDLGVMSNERAAKVLLYLLHLPQHTDRRRGSCVSAPPTSAARNEEERRGAHLPSSSSAVRASCMQALPARPQRTPLLRVEGRHHDSASDISSVFVFVRVSTTPRASPPRALCMHKLAAMPTQPPLLPRAPRASILGLLECTLIHVVIRVDACSPPLPSPRPTSPTQTR